jgi:hypothetical protein
MVTGTAACSEAYLDAMLQVRRCWPLVEDKATSFTWGLLANYYPEYAAERILQSEERLRVERLNHCMKYLCTHVPDAAWAAYQSLPWTERAEVKIPPIFFRRCAQCDILAMENA